MNQRALPSASLAAQPQWELRQIVDELRAVRAQWRDFSMQLAATPAGLWELAPQAKPDLLLTVTDTSPLDLARSAMQGERPAVRIEGDVQFAAEVNWLVDHVRWDAEEDLSRLIGDAPAHTLANLGRGMADALRNFVSKLPGQDKAAR